MHNSKLYAVLFFCLIGYSCANIVPPDGGAKDTQAPKLLFVNPPNKSLQFQNKQKIIFEFDEYVQVSTEGNAITLLPNTAQVSMVSYGKTVKAIINGTLEPNTTYTLMLQNAIKDITESNASVPITYVFSTGRNIDTQQIKIKLTGEQINYNETWVGLFPNNASWQDIFQFKTNYILHPLQDGTLTFQNLKKGSYRIFALQDQNKNKKYDAFREVIATHTQEVILQDSSNVSLELPWFREQTDSMFLLNYKNINAHLSRLFFSKKIDKINLENKIKNWSYYVKIYGDSIDLWHSGIDNISSVKIEFNGIYDSLDLSKGLNIRNKTYKLKPVIGEYEVMEYLSSNKIKIPVAPHFENINQEYFYLCTNKDTLPKQSYQISLCNPDTVCITFQQEKGKTYDLKFASGFITEPYSKLNNDPKIIKIISDKNSQLGKIELKKGKVKWKNYFVFIKDKNTIIKKILSSQLPLTLQDIPVGQYSIWLVEDVNNNGKYDSGKLQPLQMPETKIQIGRGIDVKAQKISTILIEN